MYAYMSEFNLLALQKKKISEEGIDLISKMLTYDPKLRISADEALNHPWIKQMGVKETNIEQA